MSAGEGKIREDESIEPSAPPASVTGGFVHEASTPSVSKHETWRAENFMRHSRRGRKMRRAFSGQKRGSRFGA